jgi:T-complex protein 1 subunit delta
LEVIPFTLAENAGLSPIQVVTELRNKHLKGEKDAGVSLKRFGITSNIGILLK